jgi:hypothetical protein
MRTSLFCLGTVLLVGSSLSVACATATDTETNGAGGSVTATGGVTSTGGSGGVFGTGGGNLGGAASGGAASGGAATGGGTSTGGSGTGGTTFDGECAGYPAYSASWMPGADSESNKVVSTCGNGTPCCVTPGCNPTVDPVVSGPHLFECTADHKPNCTSQDPGTMNWSTPPWTRLGPCE